MKQQINIEESLWNYIDGGLKGDDLSFVEKMVAENSEWKNRYAELMEIHSLMKNSLELDEPSMRFTQNVMEDISRLYITPATRTYINKNVIRGIGLFFLVSIVGLVIYSLGQVNWAENGTGSIPSLEIGKIDYSKFFNNSYTTIFMMINVILALMLVDMYLTQRKMHHVDAKQGNQL
jgi:hypothetical protein